MNPRRMNILIIDDDPDYRKDLTMLLSSECTTIECETAEEGLEKITAEEIDVVLLDIDLGKGMDGLTCLQELLKVDPHLPVIMVTGDERVSTIVASMRLGAFDYVGKEPSLDGLKISLRRAIEESNLRRDHEILREEVQALVGSLVGTSKAMVELKKEITRLAVVNTNVLILGESGTGKELVARAIHDHSSRATSPFVAFNCAAISRDLFESELFGHERGSFTGAVSRRIGRFEQARSGTIFLDEISEIELPLQAKLLRVLQERSFERVGGSTSIECQARIIASSNRDLKSEVSAGRFRQDLYYRLNVAPILVPPLRDRREDILLLAQFFTEKHAREMKKRIVDISEDALEALLVYDWPGNVRELENCVQNAIVHAEGPTLEKSHFTSLFGDKAPSFEPYHDAKEACLAQFHREYFKAILKLTGGNVSRAASRAGISRQGLIKIMKSSDISGKDEAT